MSVVELTFAREFKEDVEAQVDWLESEHPSWIPKLERGLVEAFELLTDFPRAGAAAPTPPIRKLVLLKLPFVVWYSFDEDSEIVELLRLFHARQRRPRAH
ncbi:MAG: type II toxin-antitoxin system RelE/ParE family toxin [Archangium sp.]|nr:type II toxin-antitoxin system RelE/ParE family toxin [Archangium sp.]